jgi:hypothetical protein
MTDLPPPSLPAPMDIDLPQHSNGVGFLVNQNLLTYFFPDDDRRNNKQNCGFIIVLIQHIWSTYLKFNS